MELLFIWCKIANAKVSSHPTSPPMAIQLTSFGLKSPDTWRTHDVDSSIPLKLNFDIRKQLIFVLISLHFSPFLDLMVNEQNMTGFFSDINILVSIGKSRTLPEHTL